MLHCNRNLTELSNRSYNTKYLKWYFSIIEKALERNAIAGYTENHHILPKSLGGSNNSENIVSLTAREHFICHMLLSKMVIDKTHKKKMMFAFLMLAKCNNQNQQRIITGRIYNSLRTNLSILSSGENNHFFGKSHTEETRRKIGNKSMGRIPNNETREKMSLSHTGKKKDPEVVKKQVATRIANGNHRHSEKTKKAMSEARLGYKTNKPSWNTGKTKETDPVLARMSESLQGKIPWNKNISKDDPRRQAGERNSFFGKRHSEETLSQIREKAQNRVRKECEHCGKTITPSNYSRWHGENCKENYVR